jgi:tetratricopeptide (TPR) repeat protein
MSRSRLFLIAAAVLVVAAAFVARGLFSRPKSSAELAQIAGHHMEPFPIPPIHGTLDPNAPYRAGIDAYRRGEYQLAAEKFWLISQDASHWPGLHFYRGLALLNVGNARGAAAAFEQHLRLNASARPARWYHALALLSLGQEKQARDELRALAEDPQTDYREKSLALLAELK